MLYFRRLSTDLEAYAYELSHKDLPEISGEPTPETYAAKIISQLDLSDFHKDDCYALHGMLIEELHHRLS